MAEQVIDNFNQMARSILGYLKLSFPHPSDIGPASLSLPFTGGGRRDEGEWVKVEMTSEEKLFHGTMQWLHKSGFIYGKVGDDGSIAEAVLTEKGLESQNVHVSLTPSIY